MFKDDYNNSNNSNIMFTCVPRLSNDMSLIKRFVTTNNDNSDKSLQSQNKMCVSNKQSVFFYGGQSIQSNISSDNKISTKSTLELNDSLRLLNSQLPKQKPTRTLPTCEEKKRMVIKVIGECENEDLYSHDYLACKKCKDTVNLIKCFVAGCPCNGKGKLIKTYDDSVMRHQMPDDNKSVSIHIRKVAEVIHRVQSRILIAKKQRKNNPTAFPKKNSTLATNNTITNNDSNRNDAQEGFISPSSRSGIKRVHRNNISMDKPLTSLSEPGSASPKNKKLKTSTTSNISPSTDMPILSSSIEQSHMTTTAVIPPMSISSSSSEDKTSIIPSNSTINFFSDSTPSFLLNEQPQPISGAHFPVTNFHFSDMAGTYEPTEDTIKFLDELFPYSDNL